MRPRKKPKVRMYLLEWLTQRKIKIKDLSDMWKMTPEGARRRVKDPSLYMLDEVCRILDIEPWQAFVDPLRCDRIDNILSGGKYVTFQMRNDDYNAIVSELERLRDDRNEEIANIKSTPLAKRKALWGRLKYLDKSQRYTSSIIKRITQRYGERVKRDGISPHGGDSEENGEEMGKTEDIR